MDEHVNAAVTKRGRTNRIAALLVLLASGLLLWEAASLGKPAQSRRPPGPRVVASRAPSPPALAVTKPEPEPTVAVSPPPPPPPVEPAAPVDPKTLHVSDILVDPLDPAARFAVIDGVAVRAGETIGGHQVVKVLPDRVLIGEEGIELLLPQTEDH